MRSPGTMWKSGLLDRERDVEPKWYIDPHPVALTAHVLWEVSPMGIPNFQ
ncbi:MAG: hypothetical protein J4F97_06785 [Pseudomonadales bacterium]|nr:hypothetical protein [Pseudomonadales bacterium]